MLLQLGNNEKTEVARFLLETSDTIFPSLSVFITSWCRSENRSATISNRSKKLPSRL